VTSVVAASELALCADGLLAACGSGSGAAVGTAWTTLTVDRMVSESTDDLAGVGPAGRHRSGADGLGGDNRLRRLKRWRREIGQMAMRPRV
jgi:hypothetical protein